MAWNRSDPSRVENARRPRKGNKMIAFLATICLLAGCVIVGYYVWSGSGGKSQTVQMQPKKIPAEKPSKAPKYDVAKERNIEGQPQTNVVAKFENEYEKMFPNEKIESVQTNKTGYIEIHGIKFDGTTTVHIVEPPSIFKHPTDEIILYALNSPIGKPIPPLPNLGGKRSDLAFMKALKDPILDEAQDSAKVRAYKDMVRTARDEIKKRMEAGESFSNIINDHVNMINENTNLRAKAQKELMEYIANGDTEGARTYYKVINGQFTKMGITPLKLSEKNSHIAKDPE